MSVTKPTKFNFRGIWYPSALVREAAFKTCHIVGAERLKYADNEQFQELVDEIVKGPPTPCARFIVALNEGICK